MITRIITSGAYVGSELEAEFGHIPPSFLPVGTGLLIDRQIERLRSDDCRLILSLPCDFEIEPAITEALTRRGLTIVRTDPALSLGRSVASLLQTLSPQGAVEIIHGDTLITLPGNDAPGTLDAPDAPDAMSVGPLGDGYQWANARVEDGVITAIADDQDSSVPPMILTGFFRFSQPDALLRALEETGHRFVAALGTYCALQRVAAVESQGWLDFGHVQTYFRSRHHLAATRHFNSLSIRDGVVHKSSAQSFKLAAEAHWLRSLPAPMQIYAARLIEDLHHAGGADDAAAGYATEYAYLPTLAEIALSRLGRSGWSRILDAAGDYLSAEAATIDCPNATDALRLLAVDKCRDRIAAHPAAYPDIDRELTINGRRTPTGRAMIAHIEGIIAAAPPQPASIMHGDFCFSNILYNSRNQRVTVIDPRGFVRDGAADPMGDLRYDLAKFAHSVIGRYDHILAGATTLDRAGDTLTLTHAPNARMDWLEGAFLERRFAGIPAARDDIMATMISLFIAMVPLHSDQPGRQQMFYANAAALFARFFG